MRPCMPVPITKEIPTRDACHPMAQSHPIHDWSDVEDILEGTWIMYRLRSSTVFEIEVVRVRIPSGTDHQQSEPWLRSDGERCIDPLERVDFIHRCQLRDTCIDQSHAKRAHEISPKQACLSAVSGDEKGVSASHVNTQNLMLSIEAHASKTSQVQMSVLPKPRIDRNRKFRLRWSVAI